MFYIFTSGNITFSKYAFYFINNSLCFITLYIIKRHDVVSTLMRRFINFVCTLGIGNKCLLQRSIALHHRHLKEGKP